MIELGVISYAIAGVVYAILAALLLVSWRGQRIGGLLIVACLVSVLWATSFAASAYGIPLPAPAAYVVELLRSGVWLVFLVTLLGRIGIDLAPHGVRAVVSQDEGNTWEQHRYILGYGLKRAGRASSVLLRDGKIYTMNALGGRTGVQATIWKPE